MRCAVKTRANTRTRWTPFGVLVCLAACAAGQNDFNAGMEAAQQDGREADARDAFERACLAGHAAGCYHFEGLIKTRKLHAPDDFKTASSPLEGRCLRGDPRACFDLALLLDDDGGRPIDGRRALVLYNAACDGGYDYACTRVGSSHPDAPQRAHAAFLEACDAGYGDPCLQAARVLAATPSLEAPPGEVERLEALGCARGSVPACRDRALALLKEEGPESQALALVLLDPAVELLEGSCEMGDPRACFDLANLNSDSALPLGDLELARALFRRACDGDHGAACLTLSEMMSSGEGGSANAAMAAEFAEQGRDLLRDECLSGYTGACWAILPR